MYNITLNNIIYHTLTFAHFVRWQPVDAEGSLLKYLLSSDFQRVASQPI
jgi:hypothetical protein